MLQRLKLAPEFDGSVWRYANPAGLNRRHHHAELELNLVTRGTGTYLLGNRRYSIRRGDLLWLFPIQEHVLFEQTSDFKMWVVVFKRRAIRRCAIDSEARALLQRSFSGEACRRLKQLDLARLEDVFQTLSAHTNEPGFTNAGLSYALLSAWSCFQRASDVRLREIHPAVERAARFLVERNSDPKLEELANLAGLSPSRLSRLFKQQTGLSIVEFRNRQRIQRFLNRFDAQIEDGSQINLLNAALDAGFGSYPQFHRVFRKIIGCTPADYQIRHKL